MKKTRKQRQAAIAKAEAHKNVTKKKTAAAGIKGEVGSLGVSTGSPVGDNMKTPKELRGAAALRTFEHMQSDSIIGTFMYFMRMTFRAKEWNVEPFDESAEARADADFIQDSLDGMTSKFNSVVSEALSMVVYGFSVFEIVYKLNDDGKIVWRKFAPRAQTSIDGWKIDKEGGLDGVKQKTANGWDTVTIPIEKCLLFRPEVTLANPWGKSLLIPAYIPWYLRQKLNQYQLIGVERDYAGILSARVPSQYLSANATDDDKAFMKQIEKALSQLRRNEREYIALPSDRDANGNLKFEVELMKSGGTRQHDLKSMLQEIKVEILMTFLADFLILGHGNVGTYALGVTKSDLLLSSIEGLAQAVVDVINDFAIPRVMELNGNTSGNYPTLTTPEFSKMDTTSLTNFLRGASIDLTDHETQNHLRRMMGLPELDETDVTEPVAEPDPEPIAKPAEPAPEDAEAVDA